MLHIIQENLGTILVALVLAAIIGLILWKLIKDKRAGKSSCGCNCSGCANAGMCHSKKSVADDKEN